MVDLGSFIVKAELKVVDHQHLWMVFKGAAQKKGDVLILLLASIRLEWRFVLIWFLESFINRIHSLL